MKNKNIKLEVNGICRDCNEIALKCVYSPTFIESDGKAHETVYTAFCEHQNVCKKLEREVNKCPQE